MRRRFSVFLGLTVVFIASIPAAGEVTLRYEWRVGDVFILNKVIDLAGTIRGGTAPPMAMSQRARVRKKLIVEQVDPEGRAQLSVALLSVSATKSVGENELHYSLSPDRVVMDNTQIWQGSVEPEGISPKIEYLQRLFRPRRMECSAQGQTADPSRPDPWLTNASQSDFFQLLGIGEEGWLPLPERPLQPGDTWQDGLAQPVRSGTSEFWHETQLRLDRLESEDSGAVATIGFERERRLKGVSRDFASSALNTSPPLKVRLIESHQRFAGEVDFNVDEGHLLRCDAKGQARLRYSLGGGDLPLKLCNLIVEYDWERVRVRSEWERIESD